MTVPETQATTPPASPAAVPQPGTADPTLSWKTISVYREKGAAPEFFHVTVRAMEAPGVFVATVFGAGDPKIDHDCGVYWGWPYSLRIVVASYYAGLTSSGHSWAFQFGA